MMPQFDTFSFFSQLFWVFICFTYLYFVLCLYLLPAFASVLKIRAKKLAQTNSASKAEGLVNNSTINFLFFDTLTTKFNNISFYRNDLPTVVNRSYTNLLVKNESFFQFKFLILNQIKAVSFFI